MEECFMNKGNKKGLVAMIIAAIVIVVVVAVIYRSFSGNDETAVAEVTGTEEKTAAGETAEGKELIGEASGFGGTIEARVIVDADNNIIGLTLTGEGETPAIGGAALEELTDAILAAGTIDGVDAVTDATFTSNGVFNAIKAALGENEEEGVSGDEVAAEVEATGLWEGLGFLPSGRVGPGSDVYSFEVVAAYALFDDDGRILDIRMDQLEVATDNYETETAPRLTGWPGQSYEGSDEQTDDSFKAQVVDWKTKRERGSAYNMTSGTWAEEMDEFEKLFVGMTVDEVQDFYDRYCSDSTGKILKADSKDEAEAAKYDALTDEEKAELDAFSGATMSLNDQHGDLIGAIVKAYENKRPVQADHVTGIGLGFTSLVAFPEAAYAYDSEGVGMYDIYIMFAGTAYSDDDTIASVYVDSLEIATPNNNGAFTPVFTGFPGTSFNTDADHDGVVEGAFVQTEENFLEEVSNMVTKRERGNTYNMPSGTWYQEMDAFENGFRGMKSSELESWFDTFCNSEGKIVFEPSDDEESTEKYEALTDEQIASMDAFTGATMSIRNESGDLLTTIIKAWDDSKATDITID